MKLFKSQLHYTKKELKKISRASQRWPWNTARPGDSTAYISHLSRDQLKPLRSTPDMEISSNNKHVESPSSRTKIYAARMSRGSSNIRCPRPTSAANPLAAAAAVDRRDRRTDERTDSRPFYDAYRGRVIITKGSVPSLLYMLHGIDMQGN